MELLGYGVPIWSLLFSLIAVGLVILYRYLSRDFGYWKSQGIITEKPNVIFGTEYAMLKKPIHEVDMERHKRLGRIYGLYFMGKVMLNVAEPEMIKNILVKDFPIFINRQRVSTGISILDKGLTVLPGEDWKRVRSVVSPTFTSGKIRKMAILVKDLAEKLTKNFLDAASKGETVESKKLFASFTMDVISSCAFGVEVDSLQTPDHPFVVNSAKLFNKGASVLTIILFFFPFLMKPLKNYLFKATGFQYFADVATNMLNLRKSEDANQKRVDFLQLMLDAQEGKLEKTEESPDLDSDSHYTQVPVESKPWVSTKSISEEEILSQCVIFLLAGHETTATAINYVIYNLAMNPDVQEKLLQEVDEAWQKNGDIDYDAVNKMQYLNNVVSETLRIHVVALRLVREASEDYTIPNTSIVVPKGGLISIPAYAMHHDPEFFPDPEKFNPDRFLPENKDMIQPYTYLPFGDGPRNCVGMRFALMTVKLCIVHVLRQIKFVATEETKKPLEFVVGQSILQAKNLVVKPEKRIKF